MKDKIINEIVNRKSSLNFSNEKITNEEISILIEATKSGPLHQEIFSHGKLYLFQMKVFLTSRYLIHSVKVIRNGPPVAHCLQFFASKTIKS